MTELRVLRLPPPREVFALLGCYST